MSTPLPSELAPGPSTSTGALLLVTVLLLVIAPLVILISAYRITYRRLEEGIEDAEWLHENLLPMVEEKVAAQTLQGNHKTVSESMELSSALGRYVSFTSQII